MIQEAQGIKDTTPYMIAAYVVVSVFYAAYVLSLVTRSRTLRSRLERANGKASV